MKITLKSLRLLNFKGLRTFEFTPDGQNVTVYGQNEAGKSTLYDAFLWLMFNKNSDGASDFNIKTLDKNNNPLHKLDHEVEAVLDVDGREMTLKKTYREKWQKKRGSETPEFVGHETAYFWDEVPVSQKEYKEKIEWLCDEGIFKLITNPLAFNALKWQDRRNILFEIAGDVSDADVAAGKKSFQELLDKLNGKKFEDYKKQIAAQKKRLRDELDQIPTRIDEINRNMPEMPDAKAIESKIASLSKQVDEIDDKIADITKANQAANEAKMKRQNEIHELRSQAQAIKFRIETEYNNDKNRKQQVINSLQNGIKNRYASIENLERNIKANEKFIESREKDIERLKETIDQLRVDWTKVNESELTFDENEFICPACKRELDSSNIEEKKAELTANFHRDKLKKLERISAEGKAKKAEIQEKEKEIESFKEKIDVDKDQIESISAEINDLETRLTDLRFESEEESQIPVQQLLECNGDFNAIMDKIEALEIEQDQEEPAELPDTTFLKAQKRDLQAEIDELKAQLSAKDHIKRSQARITELEAESKKLGAEIAKLEKEEFVMEQFEKAKVAAVEESINGKFNIAEFKMYNFLINGGTEPTCQTMYKGVPWQDINTAGKIQVGLDIISTLSKHYGVQAPIFLDGRESVVSIPEMDAQIINLIVSAKDKKLRVEIDEKEAVEA